jgi:hypothetical protein
MLPFNPRQVGACSAPTLYLHSSQYSCHCHGMPFIPYEPLHQPFVQVYNGPQVSNLMVKWSYILTRQDAKLSISMNFI